MIPRGEHGPQVAASEIHLFLIEQELAMAEKKGGAKPGGKNITVPSAAAMRQPGVRGQAGGAQRQQAGQQQAKQAQAKQAKQGKIEIMASRQFTNWLADQNASLAFTTYQVGKVFLLGLR
ncbi:MAG: hypothetical protein QF894_14280, partial [Alphaproteobacteria bacterium]|nr:hypothetical protein [Alphaproteobacteria bacterium]